VGVLFEEALGGEDHTRRAVAALERLHFDERLLERMSPTKPFDRYDLAPLRKGREQDTCRDRLPVHQSRARAADPHSARLTDAREVQLAPQDTEQHLVGSGFDLNRLSVYSERNLQATSPAPPTWS
jgi:hypothetical protein